MGQRRFFRLWNFRVTASLVNKILYSFYKKANRYQYIKNKFSARKIWPLVLLLLTHFLHDYVFKLLTVTSDLIPSSNIYLN